MTTTPRARKYRLRPGGAAADRAAAGAPEGDATAPGGAASAGEEIAQIRQEGLTGRQLRLARRTAQKHGLAASSDLDAVRLLRAKGVDPFRKPDMLQLVPRGRAPATTGGPAQLPQTVPDRADEPPAPPEPAAASREQEIAAIQRDIARRRRLKLALLLARLAVFVLLPTALAGYYYYVMATPMYATQSDFVIESADTPSAGGGLGGLFSGTGLATQQDSATVQSYLQSRDAMMRLDADLGFKAHFSQDRIDPIQRLPGDASNEDAYDVYRDRVEIGYDPTEGILKMQVTAADPETSAAFAKALISYAEERVDNLTRRKRADQMKGAQATYAEAEARVGAAQDRVLDLQRKLGVLDPETEMAALMEQVTTFETQLQQKRLKLRQLLDNARPNEARVDGVRGDIERLEGVVGDLRARMTEGAAGRKSLAGVSAELRIAEGDLANRQLLLQQALSQLESARIAANRQARYLSLGVSPVAPDEATYPRAFQNTALAFVIFSGFYLMISLTASILREQVAA